MKHTIPMKPILIASILLLPVLQLAAGPEARDATPFPKPPSIKGLQVQMNDDALALGIHHAGVNINITGLVDLEKRPENPKRSVNGFEFSFHEAYLKHLDGQIKPLSDKGVLVYLIVIAYPSKNEAVDSLVIHPDARKDYQYTVGGFNSKTPEGRAWLKAVSMEMASRWSGARPECGRVWGWIVGNEVNSHWVWSNMGEKTLGQAAAEYAQAFRIIHGSVRAAPANARLYISFDHHWGSGMHGMSAEEAASGRDYLDAFAKLNGDLDWHVAWHPYPEDLRNPRAWADATAVSDNSSHKVTFKNLEVLCRHLRKPELLFEGESRRVILSEQGFHMPPDADGETLQAAAYAYGWEKCKRLPLVDAFIYHRHVDHSQEGGLLLGLWKNVPGSVADPAGKKQIWELFLKAGTSEWEAAAATYLPVTGLKSWDDLAGE